MQKLGQIYEPATDALLHDKYECVYIDLFSAAWVEIKMDSWFGATLKPKHGGL